MATKLSEGDSIGMQGEVTLVHDDGTVTVRLLGYDVAVTNAGRTPATDREAATGQGQAATGRAGLGVV